MSSDDDFWRRPGGPAPEPPAPAAMPEIVYTPPPRTAPPPPNWRPAVVVEPEPPRDLPRQDHAVIDAAERSARTLTLGVGMIIGAVALIMMFVLCARLF